MKTLHVGALAAAVLWSASLQADELKLAHFMPPTHPMDVHVMTPMAQAYNQAMAGESEIKVYPAGELGSGPKAQYKRVSTGVAELAFILPDFSADLFPVLTSYEIPGRYADGIQATKAM